jgi:hypothetical protein
MRLRRNRAPGSRLGERTLRFSATHGGCGRPESPTLGCPPFADRTIGFIRLQNVGHTIALATTQWPGQLQARHPFATRWTGPLMAGAASERDPYSDRSDNVVQRASFTGGWAVLNVRGPRHERGHTHVIAAADRQSALAETRRSGIGRTSDLPSHESPRTSSPLEDLSAWAKGLGGIVRSEVRWFEWCADAEPVFHEADRSLHGRCGLAGRSAPLAVPCGQTRCGLSAG